MQCGESSLQGKLSGMMGYRTPHIDRIAAEGAMFTD
jgi:hypothetical protein